MVCKKCKKEILEAAKFCPNCGEVLTYADKTIDNSKLQPKKKNNKLVIIYIILCIMHILCYNPFFTMFCYDGLDYSISLKLYNYTWTKTLKKYGYDDFKSEKYIEYYKNREKTCVYDKYTYNIITKADKSDCVYTISIDELNAENLPHYDTLQSAYIHFHPGASEYQKTMEESSDAFYNNIKYIYYAMGILLFIVIIICAVKLFKINKIIAILGISVVILSTILFYIFLILLITFGGWHFNIGVQ